MLEKSEWNGDTFRRNLKSDLFEFMSKLVIEFASSLSFFSRVECCAITYNN